MCLSQAQSLGIDIDETLSPSLLENVSYVGTLLKSFRQGDVAIERLLDVSLGHKRLEGITERIGAERLVEADQEMVAFKALTLAAMLRPARQTEKQSANHLLNSALTPIISNPYDQNTRHKSPNLGLSSQEDFRRKGEPQRSRLLTAISIRIEEYGTVNEKT